MFVHFLRFFIMVRKQTIKEADNITDLEKLMLNTSLHGAITSLSPIKKGGKSLFFDRMLTDDTSKVRVVGFEAHQQKKLNELCQKNGPIQLVDCEVKKKKLETVRVTKFCSKQHSDQRVPKKTRCFTSEG